MNALDLWNIHIGKHHPFNDRAPRIDNGAKRLDAARYTDPAFAKAEWDKVFARSWQLIAGASQLSGPGDHVVADISDTPILIVRGNDGVLRGFITVCRHRAGPPADRPRSAWIRGWP